MFKFLSKQKKKESPAMLVAQLNARVQPMERGELFEDALQELLEEAGLGEVSGGGTLLSQIGEVEYCDIEIMAPDQEPATVKALIAMLEKLGAPKGSKLLLEGGAEVPFGTLEGVAVYLNGTDLPDKVYQECDSNHVYAEFNRLLEGAGAVKSAWTGPRETAFYMYGASFEEMRNRLAGFLATYPLCERARVVQIA